MKKLEQYKKAITAIEEIETQLQSFEEISDVEITPNMKVYSTSTNKQFIYGLGVLYNQVKAAKDLSLLDEVEEYESKIKQLKNLLIIRASKKLLSSTLVDMKNFVKKLYPLLSNNQKAQLIKNPFDNK